MNEESQVDRVNTLRGGHDSAEMARRATKSREANIAQQVAENRQKLMKLAPKAIDTLEGVLDGEARPNLAPTAFGILDRTGNGPTSKTEVTVGPNEHLVELIKRLDAEESERAANEAQSTRNEVIDIDSHDRQAVGELEAGGSDQASSRPPPSPGDTR